MALPEGWRRIRRGEEGYSATARTYYDPEGRIRSRRAADNERIRAEGWESKRDFDTRFRARKNRGYARWADAALEAGEIDEEDLRSSKSEFNRLFLDFRNDPSNRSPDGPLALLLVYIGLRTPDATWDVGDTPVMA